MTSGSASVQSKNNDAFFLCRGNQSVSTCKLLVSIDTGSTKSLGRSTDCKDQSFAVIWKICACDVLIHCYFNASLCAKCICNVYISTLSNTGQDSRSRAHTCADLSQFSCSTCCRCSFCGSCCCGFCSRCGSCCAGSAGAASSQR